MERMLRKKKNSECEYEIDRELTGKFAIEKNAEYQDRIAELEEENKKLKFDIEARKEMKKAREEKIQTLELWLDNKEKVNKSLREELEKLKSTYVYDAKQVRDIC